MRRVPGRRPGGERVERPERREVPPEPAAALRGGRFADGPDVGAGEVRSAGVLVADALNERELAGVEDVAQPGQPRVQAERFPVHVAADLQHRAGRNRQRRTPAVIERIGVRHQRAEAVVATRERQHHEISAGRALRAREIREECGRGEADREGRRAVFDELASADHTSWYSADPRMRCARPDALVCSCVSEPVHVPEAVYASRSPYMSPALAGVSFDSMKLSTACADPFAGCAAVPSRNFWFDASVDAKFIRASILPVENHNWPRSQPATSGGSNSCCPMFTSGVSADCADNPVHPVSLIDLTTYSTGQL